MVKYVCDTHAAALRSWRDNSGSIESAETRTRKMSRQARMQYESSGSIDKPKI
jgi:hypothetical protein